MVYLITLIFIKTVALTRNQLILLRYPGDLDQSLVLIELGRILTVQVQ